MAERGSGRRGALIAAAVVAVAIAGWLALQRDGSAPEPAQQPAPADPGAPVASTPAPAPSPTAPPPAHQIPEHGRITLEATALEALDVVALDLGLPAEARGDAPLPAVVVGVDGRRLETQVVPLAGDAGGVRIELDPGWLRPGRYMIHVTTAEQTPLHFRRYVIEVE